MIQLYRKILLVDEAQDYAGLEELLSSASIETVHLRSALVRLLQKSRLHGAYLVAEALRARGGGGYCPVQLTIAVWSMLTGNRTEEQRQTAALGVAADALTVDQQGALYQDVVSPALVHVAERAVADDDRELVLRGLEILRAAVPRLREVFDLAAPVLPFDLEERRRQGRRRARLLALPSPPSGMPRLRRRVVIAIRKYFYPGWASSRKHDIGPRLVAAARHYGWAVAFHEMDIRPEDYRGIVEACIRHDAELLIFDDELIKAASSHSLRAAMMAHLREKIPGLKLVAMHMDPWSAAPELLIATASTDLIWAVSPSLTAWQDPVFADRLFQLPPPFGGYHGRPAVPLSDGMVFAGGIMKFAWHRLFWRAAAMHHGLPVDWQLSFHREDDLPALDSYLAYMARLTEATCCLNLSMRSDMSRIITGRSFEAVTAGSLLVQEACDDMDHYFIEGEHYLSFSSFAELRSIAAFIKAHPAVAEEVRRNGNDFAIAQYGDDKVMACLDHRLFWHPACAASPGA